MMQDHIPHLKIIQPLTLEGVALATNVSLTSPASAIWAAANRAWFWPFHLQIPVTITKLRWLNGSNANGNLDIGIYSAGADGPEALIVSSGSTAQVGTDVVQSYTLPTPRVIGPGDFFMAMVMDNATGTIYRASGGLSALRHAGIKQQNSAFPLPATATPAVLTTAVFYMCGAERL